MPRRLGLLHITLGTSVLPEFVITYQRVTICSRNTAGVENEKVFLLKHSLTCAGSALWLHSSCCKACTFRATPPPPGSKSGKEVVNVSEWFYRSRREFMRCHTNGRQAGRKFIYEGNMKVHQVETMERWEFTSTLK